MDRRRTVALILGLALCLALLGIWFVRGGKEDATPAKTPVAVESTRSEGAIEIAQVPRQEPNAGGTFSYAAPIGPGMFRGRVIDAVTREPIREFTVELLPPLQSNAPGREIRQSFRTKDGRFTYPGLPEGTWTILTRAAGYQRFDMPDTRITDSVSVEEVTIPMRAGHVLRGRVVDEATNEGIAAARISFREASVGRYEGNFRRRPSVLSGKDGSFTLDGVPPGAVRLEVGAQKYVIKEVDVFVSGKASPLEIALSKGGTVAGYLSGLDGLTPVKGEVSLGFIDGSVTFTRATGSAGEFSFQQLAAGHYLLTGRGDRLNGRREITLAHNEQLEGIVLPMTAGHSIRGVISGLRPDEHTATFVIASALDGNISGATHQANPNERGAYEVTGVAPGLVAIEAVSERQGRLTKTVQMPADGDLTVHFEYKTEARLSGRVSRGGKPLAGAVLQISAATADEGLFMHSIVTAGNGDYAAGDVPRGEYTFTVEGYSTANVRVAGDTVFDFDVPDAQVSGRVFEDGGKVPLVGALVNVRPMRPAPRTNSLDDRADHFGQFAIRGLEPGNYLLSAYKPGYELYRAPLSYSSPIADMAIYMRPARGVEIRVRDADNNTAMNGVFVLELLNGGPGVGLQISADQNGVGYLPSGLAGSSLRFMAMGYQPLEINDWNGQQLDVNLRRQPVP